MLEQQAVRPPLERRGAFRHVKRLTFVVLAALAIALVSSCASRRWPPDPPRRHLRCRRACRPRASSTAPSTTPRAIVLPDAAPGTTRLMRVNAENGAAITSVRAPLPRWPDRFFSADDGFYGLIAAGMEQQTSRTNPLDVFVTYADGSATRSTPPSKSRWARSSART